LHHLLHYLLMYLFRYLRFYYALYLLMKMTKQFLRVCRVKFSQISFCGTDRRRVCATRQINQTVEKLEEEVIDSRRGIKNK